MIDQQTLDCNEWQDAPFCAGDSVQGAAEPPDPEPEPVRDLPFGSVFADCGPSGPYLDIAVSVGDHQLAVDGVQVAEWTTNPDDVSDSLGLDAVNWALDSDTGEVLLYSVHDGVTSQQSSSFDADCTDIGTALVVERDPDPAVLPEAGVGAGGLALTAVLALVSGYYVLRGA